MRFIRRQSLLCLLHNSKFFENKDLPKQLVRQYVTVITNNCPIFRNHAKTLSVGCAYLSDGKKHFLKLERQKDALKDAFEHKKEQLKNTEIKIRQRGGEFVRDIKNQKVITGQILRDRKEIILKDILETKNKVKERIGEVVERENIYTIPNTLCVTRIILSPAIGYLVLQENYNFALGLFVLAGVTDLLDGWIARTWVGQSSKVGSFLDPMADKVLIATLFVSLTWQNLIPLALTLLIITRDAILVTAGLIIRYKSLPKPRTISMFLDFTHATAQLAPTFLSKVNTTIQLILVGTTVAAPVLGFVDHPALQTLCGITAVSTVASALSYLFSKNTYKFIKKS